jgi:hypothetical protein
LSVYKPHKISDDENINPNTLYFIEATPRVTDIERWASLLVGVHGLSAETPQSGHYQFQSLSIPTINKPKHAVHRAHARQSNVVYLARAIPLTPVTNGTTLLIGVKKRPINIANTPYLVMLCSAFFIIRARLIAKAV